MVLAEVNHLLEKAFLGGVCRWGARRSARNESCVRKRNRDLRLIQGVGYRGSRGRAMDVLNGLMDQQPKKITAERTGRKVIFPEERYWRGQVSKIFKSPVKL
jgi:hypothetical protein